MRPPKADEGKRRAFQAKIKQYQSAKRLIVYSDESGFAQDMPRTHGCSPRGKRCFGNHDWHARGRINVIGAVLAKAVLTVGLTPTNVDTDMFNLWLRNDLVPRLPPGSVIVRDTATFHKRQDTQTMIAHAGHILEYLPPYSPDLNPIEHKSAQAKTIKRKTGTSGDEIFRQKFRSRLQSSCYRMVARHR